jgi:hypothetical protein
VFCRLAQPMVRKVKIDIQRVIPGVVYEDKSLYKYELPKQITLNNGKISDFKQIKSLSSFEFFRRAQREFNKNSLMLKTKNN